MTDADLIPRCACGITMSRNPHPEAGKLETLLTVGAIWICIPCAIKSRHGWSKRALAAERRVVELESDKDLLIAVSQSAEQERDRLQAELDQERPYYLAAREEAKRLREAAIEVFECSEFSELGCVGSMAPCEHALGMLRQALARPTATGTQEKGEVSDGAL